MAKGMTILLVDDHAVVREGYRRLLERQPDFVVVAEASDADSAYRLYKENRPDVVVMDISLPGRGGIDAVVKLRQWDPGARVLMFTMHAHATYALQAFRAGARGYVTKSSPPEVMISAVRDVAGGRVAICPEIGALLAVDRIERRSEALQDLSPREFEILGMILAAQSAQEIAKALNLSAKTVNNYHYMIKSKLGVSSDIELVLHALQHGLVPGRQPPAA